VKILGDGEITAALTIHRTNFPSQPGKITKAGGKFEVLQ